MKQEHLALLTDFYEITMANGYFVLGKKDTICYFDVFFRTTPDGGGYAIASGIHDVIDYLLDFHFEEEDIEYLKSKKIFNADFINYLKDFKFKGDVFSVKEGEVIFPYEPIMVVRAPSLDAQFIETYILMTINHQSLIATKTSRIVRAANNRAVMEFGARRSHGATASVMGARSAYLAGAGATSNTLTDFYYGVPAAGTMAHSWIELFDDELEAFISYGKIYPNNCVLLIDTYNVLKSGLPNAIKAFKSLGISKGGVRIDSGDLTYLSKKTREQLDLAGLQDIKIVVSNSLDEYLITVLLNQGAPIDSFGVGERLITAASSPVFDGVYKLSAIEVDNVIIPKIKISANVGKITNPGFKRVIRFIAKDTNKALADLIVLNDETFENISDIEIFDPVATWKRKELSNFYIKELHQQVIKNGKLIVKLPELKESRLYCQSCLDELWDEVKRLSNPQTYYVDLSQKLFDLKSELLTKWSKKL
jgi:nicotinate phosphoribosyltransferase